jgi:predicted nuclease of restriction endonuclease-like (RecB) superfamily
MSKSRKIVPQSVTEPLVPSYDHVLSGVVELLESARRVAARSVNALLTATYWEIGRRIVDFEQGGEGRAQYGQGLLQRLSTDLTARFRRGFGVDNLQRMRLFYRLWPADEIYATLSRKSLSAATLETLTEGSVQPDQIGQTVSDLLVPEKYATLSRKFMLEDLASVFPLPWSHYIQLLKVEKPEAREFYEAEALRNGWTVRQLDRQITTLFYERTLASRNKSAMLKKGAIPKPGEELSPEEEIKDPFVLEFLGLKDEYSESDLEEALIRELETFLLELGGDFTFVGRQKRLRIGDDWYRIDLSFFHRKLRGLVVIDLKLGKFTHSDAGQMHLYLNYAREHWTNEGENPPVGVILCTQKDSAVVHYALENPPPLPTLGKGGQGGGLAAEYRTTLPTEKTLAAELEAKRRLLESRGKRRKGGQS